jgi:hypothetical protein
MTRTLKGHWAYTIQGHMQSVNPHNGNPDGPKILEVGLAFQGDPTLNAFHAEYPGFSMVPLTTVPLPSFQPTPGPPALPVQAGYMPFTESGCMRFAIDGSVSGRLWFTIAGVTSYSLPFHFNGQYVFDDQVDDMGLVLPVGAISLRFVNLPPSDAFPAGFNLGKFLWDYTFIMASKDEIFLTTGGRYPRPAIASGMLKLMQASAFHEVEEPKEAKAAVR